MGYTIAIGELETVTESDGYKHKYVKTVTLDNAPAYGEPTDHMNERWPSYSS